MPLLWKSSPNRKSQAGSGERSERVHEKETSRVVGRSEHCLSDRVQSVLAILADTTHEKPSRWGFLLSFGGRFCFRSAATPFAPSRSGFLLASRPWRVGNGSSPNQNQKSSYLFDLYRRTRLDCWGPVRSWLVRGGLADLPDLACSRAIANPANTESTNPVRCHRHLVGRNFGLSAVAILRHEGRSGRCADADRTLSRPRHSGHSGANSIFRDPELRGLWQVHSQYRNGRRFDRCHRERRKSTHVRCRYFRSWSSRWSTYGDVEGRAAGLSPVPSTTRSFARKCRPCAACRQGTGHVRHPRPAVFRQLGPSRVCSSGACAHPALSPSQRRHGSALHGAVPLGSDSRWTLCEPARQLFAA